MKVRLRRRHKRAEDHKSIDHTVAYALGILITLLFVVVIALTFGLGQAWWPAWMIAGRTQTWGILSLILFFLLLWSAVMIEVDKNPRPLDGPGKRPLGY